MIVTCSYCGTRGRVPPAQKARCPKCKQDYTIAAMTKAVNEPPPSKAVFGLDREEDAVPDVTCATCGWAGAVDDAEPDERDKPCCPDCGTRLKLAPHTNAAFKYPLSQLSDSSELRALARACWPKVQHDTEDAAWAHARALVSRGVHRDLAHLHVYACHDCPSWHVGHGDIQC